MNIVKLKFVVGLLFMVGLYSCDTPKVAFLDAQPSSLQEKDKFLGKFRGAYMSESDSSILKISKFGVTQNWDFVIELEASESAKDIARNFSFSVDENDLIIEPLPDSMSYHVMYTQTVFSFKENERLKFIEGVYIMNYKQGGDSWSLKVMHFNNDGFLTIQNLDLAPEDVDRLKDIVEVKETTNKEGSPTSYIMDPSQEEFMEIIYSDLMDEGEFFKPLN